MVDSTQCRAEVAQTESALGAAKRKEIMANFQANNADPKEKESLQSKLGELSSEVGRCTMDLSSARGAYNAALDGDRRAEVAEQTEKQRTEQANIEKEAEAAKNIEKEVDKKDEKPSVAKKDMKSGTSIDPYERTGEAPEDIDAKQAALLKKVQEFVAKSEVEDSSEAVDKEPAVAAAAVSASPAIASTGSTGTAQESSSPTATSKIQGAAGTSGANA
jgi:hypothetical protein